VSPETRASVPGVVGGHLGIAILVSDSTSDRTRACYEALRSGNLSVVG